MISSSHLFYFGDSLKFIKSSNNAIHNLMHIVNLFCSISGLKLNLGKFNLLGINIPSEQVIETANEIGCRVGAWPLKYLGLPLGGSPWPGTCWELVVRKIAKRLDGWKSAYLSKRGRVTLICSVFDALPKFYLSIFQLLAGVARKMEQMMWDFLWRRMNLDSSWALVAWKEVCLPKKLGRARLWQRGAEKQDSHLQVALALCQRRVCGLGQGDKEHIWCASKCLGSGRRLPSNL
ncbi:hypothetical protein Sjap_014992 [Stephania japonica]|uniref:Uncharacterized protein n=1 Tax=Stephania japonica TaxID=461633 RepID=A0AAP0IIR5_9MAGN